MVLLIVGVCIAGCSGDSSPNSGSAPEIAATLVTPTQGDFNASSLESSARLTRNYTDQVNHALGLAIGPGQNRSCEFSVELEGLTTDGKAALGYIVDDQHVWWSELTAGMGGDVQFSAVGSRAIWDEVVSKAPSQGRAYELGFHFTTEQFAAANITGPLTVVVLGREVRHAESTANCKGAQVTSIESSNVTLVDQRDFDSSEYSIFYGVGSTTHGSVLHRDLHGTRVDVIAGPDGDEPNGHVKGELVVGGGIVEEWNLTTPLAFYKSGPPGEYSFTLNRTATPDAGCIACFDLFFLGVVGWPGDQP